MFLLKGAVSLPSCLHQLSVWGFYFMLIEVNGGVVRGWRVALLSDTHGWNRLYKVTGRGRELGSKGKRGRGGCHHQ